MSPSGQLSQKVGDSATVSVTEPLTDFDGVRDLIEVTKAIPEKVLDLTDPVRLDIVEGAIGHSDECCQLLENGAGITWPLP